MNNKGKYKVDILQLREKGKTYNEIAKTLGCKKSTISYHVGDGQHKKTLLRQRKRYNKKPISNLINSLLIHKINEKSTNSSYQK